MSCYLNFHTCRHSTRTPSPYGWFVSETCPNELKISGPPDIIADGVLCDMCPHCDKLYDWYIHFVTDRSGPGYSRNYHTHGMDQFDDHLDFQIVLDIEPMHAMLLLNMLGERVKAGERFRDGDVIRKFVNEYDGRLKEFVETGRPVLRLIVPDKHHRFPGDPGCEKMYRYQTQSMFE